MASHWEPFAELAWRPSSEGEGASATFDNRVLTIRGERKLESAEGGAFHRRAS